MLLRGGRTEFEVDLVPLFDGRHLADHRGGDRFDADPREQPVLTVVPFVPVLADTEGDRASQRPPACQAGDRHGELVGHEVAVVGGDVQLGAELAARNEQFPARLAAGAGVSVPEHATPAPQIALVGVEVDVVTLAIGMLDVPPARQEVRPSRQAPPGRGEIRGVGGRGHGLESVASGRASAGNAADSRPCNGARRRWCARPEGDRSRPHGNRHRQRHHRSIGCVPTVPPAAGTSSSVSRRRRRPRQRASARHTTRTAAE